MIKGVVFDLDGVLVDACDWHYQALNRALSLFGFQIKPHEHASLFNGLPTSVKLDLLTQRKGFPLGLHRFVNELKQRYTHQVIESSCTPDVNLSGMLRHLKTKGYKIAVASNCIRSTVELMLEKMAIKNQFDVILSNQDVEKPKPSPEIYQKAFNQLGLKPEECMVIEDSIPGIQAARQATPNVVVVTGPDEVTTAHMLQNIELFNEKLSPEEDTNTLQFGPRTVEIIIPMAGLGQRFSAVGYRKPKPLIEIFDRPMIEWVVENIRPKDRESHFTFICNQKHLGDYDLEKFLNQIAPGCTIVPVPGVTEGAACTVLLATEQMDTNRPLLIANSDQWVNADIDAFLDVADQHTCDGLIMTFKAHHKKWSFAKVKENNRVVQVAEKNPISDQATVGLYYFRQGRYFVQGAQNMIRKDIRTNGEFYVCPIFNELIQNGRDIRIHEIQPEDMHGLGTPEDLQSFISWRKSLSA